MLEGPLDTLDALEKQGDCPFQEAKCTEHLVNTAQRSDCQDPAARHALESVPTSHCSRRSLAYCDLLEQFH
jgi:hypothetical protein